MSLDRGEPGTCHASGRYVSATGALQAGSVPYFMAAGVHNGAGDNTVLLTEPIAAANCSIFITIEKATFASATYVIVDSTHIQVLTWDAAGAALAADFSIKVERNS